MLRGSLLIISPRIIIKLGLGTAALLRALRVRVVPVLLRGAALLLAAVLIWRLSISGRARVRIVVRLDCVRRRQVLWQRARLGWLRRNWLRQIILLANLRVLRLNWFQVLRVAHLLPLYRDNVISLQRVDHVAWVRWLGVLLLGSACWGRNRSAKLLRLQLLLPLALLKELLAYHTCWVLFSDLGQRVLLLLLKIVF